MEFSNNYGGGGDDRSLGSRGTNQSSIGMASLGKTHNEESFTTSTDQFDATTQNDSNLAVKITTEDALQKETENAVTKERQLLYKENAAKLQNILENIKNSTKNTLREMDIYLQETEEVEKTYIRCRANTQKESQRMEQVEPDVISATQRFMAQGAQLFGGGSMDFMNMAALTASGAAGNAGMVSNAVLRNSGSVVQPAVRGNNDSASMAAVSMAGSSVTGSMM